MTLGPFLRRVLDSFSAESGAETLDELLRAQPPPASVAAEIAEHEAAVQRERVAAGLSPVNEVESADGLTSPDPLRPLESTAGIVATAGVYMAGEFGPPARDDELELAAEVAALRLQSEMALAGPDGGSYDALQAAQERQLQDEEMTQLAADLLRRGSAADTVSSFASGGSSSGGRGSSGSARRAVRFKSECVVCHADGEEQLRVRIALRRPAKSLTVLRLDEKRGKFLTRQRRPWQSVFKGSTRRKTGYVRDGGR